MDSNVWLVASVWMALALIASLVSIRVGISVALIEILIGVAAGNFLGVHTTPWIDADGHSLRRAPARRHLRNCRSRRVTLKSPYA